MASHHQRGMSTRHLKPKMQHSLDSISTTPSHRRRGERSLKLETLLCMSRMSTMVSDNPREAKRPKLRTLLSTGSTSTMALGSRGMRQLMLRRLLSVGSISGAPTYPICICQCFSASSRGSRYARLDNSAISLPRSSSFKLFNLLAVVDTEGFKMSSTLADKLLHFPVIQVFVL